MRLEHQRLILKENLTGTDIAQISLKLGCSVSKLRSYLSGEGSNELEMGRVIQMSIFHLLNKYKTMIEDLKKEKTGIEDIDRILESGC